MVVTEPRNLDIRPIRGLNDHLTLARLDLATINLDGKQIRVLFLDCCHVLFQFRQPRSVAYSKTLFSTDERV